MSKTKNEIFNRINNIALGNSKRGLKEVASDLVNEQGRAQLKNMAAGCFQYRPQAETLERIFRYCGAEIEFRDVIIKRQYQNIPKRG